MSSLTEMIVEERALPPFDRIIFKGSGELYLRQGKEQRVEIASNKEEILDKIDTIVKRGCLTSSRKGIFPFWLLSNPVIEINITLPDLSEVRHSGIGKIVGETPFKTGEIMVKNSGVGHISLTLEAVRVQTRLSGTGDIVLRGQAVEHEVVLSGVGKVDAQDLVAQSVKVSSQGVGECLVHAEKDLKIRSTGIGMVRYRGDASVDSRKSGLGDVAKMR